MSVTVDQCPCSRSHVSVRDRVGVYDRDRVRGRVCYILSISVPIMSSARDCGRDHKFECVACTFFVDLCMHNHASFLVSFNVRFCVRDHVSVRVVSVFMAMSVVVSEAMLVAMPVSVTVPVSMSEFMFVTVFVSVLNSSK